MWLTTTIAFALPSIDEPTRTSESASADSAVVIGIEDYFVLPDVPYAERDADAFLDFAVYTRGIPSERVTRLIGQVSRERLRAAVEQAGRQTGTDGTVFVYFAGHGAASPSTGERLLLGADAQADLETFESRAVRVGELEQLATVGGASAVFLLDTCYSGWTRGGGELVEGKRFAVPTFSTESLPKVVEWSAAGPDQWSSPLDSVRHGAFTYLAVGALRGWADGERDGQRDGTVTLEEATLYVERSLQTLGVAGQRPEWVGEPSLLLARSSEQAPDLSLSPSTRPSSGLLSRWVHGEPNLWYTALGASLGGAYDRTVTYDGGVPDGDYIERADGPAVSLAGYVHPLTALDIGLRLSLHSTRRSYRIDRDTTSNNLLTPTILASLRARLPGFPRLAGLLEGGVQSLPRLPALSGNFEETDYIYSTPATVLPLVRAGATFDLFYARPTGLALGGAMIAPFGRPDLVTERSEVLLGGEILLDLTLSNKPRR